MGRCARGEGRPPTITMMRERVPSGDERLGDLARQLESLDIVTPGRRSPEPLAPLRDGSDATDLLLARVVVWTDHVRRSGTDSGNALDDVIARVLLADLALVADVFRRLAAAIEHALDLATHDLERAGPAEGTSQPD